jgi:RNA 2',3'-cyclic 3'-phosphodiesterase
MTQETSHSNSSVDPCRLFVALPLAASLVAPLERLQARLGSRPGGGAVRWTRPDQLHLTLRFLGAVPIDRVPESCRLLAEACRGTTAFELRLRGVGRFPERGEARVVWVGISGALIDLRALQASVASALSGLGDHQERRAFEPHLTIGRVRAGSRDARRVGAMVAASEAVDVGNWPVIEVVLMRSELHPEGARYTRVITVSLLGGEGRIIETQR